MGLFALTVGAACGGRDLPTQAPVNADVAVAAPGEAARASIVFDDAPLPVGTTREFTEDDRIDLKITVSKDGVVVGETSLITHETKRVREKVLTSSPEKVLRTYEVYREASGPAADAKTKRDPLEGREFVVDVATEAVTENGQPVPDEVRLHVLYGKTKKKSDHPHVFEKALRARSPLRVGDAIGTDVLAQAFGRDISMEVEDAQARLSAVRETPRGPAATFDLRLVVHAAMGPAMMRIHLTGNIQYEARGTRELSAEVDGPLEVEPAASADPAGVTTSGGGTMTMRHRVRYL